MTNDNVIPHGVFTEKDYWQAQIEQSEKIRQEAEKKLAELALREENKSEETKAE